MLDHRGQLLFRAWITLLYRMADLKRNDWIVTSLGELVELYIFETLLQFLMKQIDCHF